ncbi:hypothetical protein SNEBB_011460 [Seison nebaliae]|nr:hypothetical protein SNEBB_011460 [Seison nebaliae]
MNNNICGISKNRFNSSVLKRENSVDNLIHVFNTNNLCENGIKNNKRFIPYHYHQLPSSSLLLNKSMTTSADMKLSNSQLEEKDLQRNTSIYAKINKVSHPYNPPSVPNNRNNNNNNNRLNSNIDFQTKLNEKYNKSKNKSLFTNSVASFMNYDKRNQKVNTNDRYHQHHRHHNHGMSNKNHQNSSNRIRSAMSVDQSGNCEDNRNHQDKSQSILPNTYSLINDHHNYTTNQPQQQHLDKTEYSTDSSSFLMENNQQQFNSNTSGCNDKFYNVIPPEARLISQSNKMNRNCLNKSKFLSYSYDALDNIKLVDDTELSNERDEASSQEQMVSLNNEQRFSKKQYQLLMNDVHLTDNIKNSVNMWYRNNINNSNINNNNHDSDKVNKRKDDSDDMKNHQPNNNYSYYHRFEKIKEEEEKEENIVSFFNQKSHEQLKSDTSPNCNNEYSSSNERNIPINYSFIQKFHKGSSQSINDPNNTHTTNSSMVGDFFLESKNTSNHNRTSPNIIKNCSSHTNDEMKLNDDFHQTFNLKHNDLHRFLNNKLIQRRNSFNSSNSNANWSMNEKKHNDCSLLGTGYQLTSNNYNNSLHLYEKNDMKLINRNHNGSNYEGSSNHSRYSDNSSKQKDYLTNSRLTIDNRFNNRYMQHPNSIHNLRSNFYGDNHNSPVNCLESSEDIKSKNDNDNGLLRSSIASLGVNSSSSKMRQLNNFLTNDENMICGRISRSNIIPPSSSLFNSFVKEKKDLNNDILHNNANSNINGSHNNNNNNKKNSSMSGKFKGHSNEHSNKSINTHLFGFSHSYLKPKLKTKDTSNPTTTTTDNSSTSGVGRFLRRMKGTMYTTTQCHQQSDEAKSNEFASNSNPLAFRRSHIASRNNENQNLVNEPSNRPRTTTVDRNFPSIYHKDMSTTTTLLYPNKRAIRRRSHEVEQNSNRSIPTKNPVKITPRLDAERTVQHLNIIEDDHPYLVNDRNSNTYTQMEHGNVSCRHPDSSQISEAIEHIDFGRMPSIILNDENDQQPIRLNDTQTNGNIFYPRQQTGLSDDRSRPPPHDDQQLQHPPNSTQRIHLNQSREDNSNIDDQPVVIPRRNSSRQKLIDTINRYNVHIGVNDSSRRLTSTSHQDIRQLNDKSYITPLDFDHEINVNRLGKRNTMKNLSNKFFIFNNCGIKSNENYSKNYETVPISSQSISRHYNSMNALNDLHLRLK